MTRTYAPVGVTDRDWHLNPAHPHRYCGGCGREAADCHPGDCCTNVPDELGQELGVCDLCPTRLAAGHFTTSQERP